LTVNVSSSVHLFRSAVRPLLEDLVVRIRARPLIVKSEKGAESGFETLLLHAHLEPLVIDLVSTRAVEDKRVRAVAQERCCA
jgi:hypothetical protein